MKRRPFGLLRGHFMTGLTFGAPVVLTIWLVWSAVVMIDGWVMPFLPSSIIPADSALRTVPGVGVLIFFVAAVMLGIVTRGFLGRWIMRFWERLFEGLPVVRAVYSTLKQVTDVALGQDAAKFETACLVRYPHDHAYAIGFISTKARGEIHDELTGAEEEDVLSVFVPTTPNPTSGFLLFLPESQVIPLKMRVDDAVKLVISAGLVYPNPNDPTAPPVSANDPKLALVADDFEGNVEEQEVSENLDSSPSTGEVVPEAESETEEEAQTPPPNPFKVD